MTVEYTPFKGLVIYVPAVYTDERGSFKESFSLRKFKDSLGFEAQFVQDNESTSRYGVIRALHSQGGKYAQAKLVRVSKGRVLDVVVDVRKDEPTFGKCFSVELSSQNNKHMFIPRGFLHGFSVLSDTAIFNYKCDNYFMPSSEISVHYADPELDIDWKIPKEDQIISTKDSISPSFSQFLKGLL